MIHHNNSSEEDLEFFQKVIQDNAYSKNLLLAMIHDTNADIRKLGIRGS